MSNLPGSELAHREQLARKALDEDTHYVSSIAHLATVSPVVASEDIYAVNGVKLIAKGFAIDSGLRERIVNHVLLKPIDHSLEVKDGVGGTLLAHEIDRLVGDAPQLRQLLGGVGEIGSTQEALRGMALPTRLAFKLTVLRARMPWLFNHVLITALIGHALALRLKLPERQCTATLLTGLAHDLGELHTDPALLDRRHKMSEDELHHIDVHPITGHLIAKELLPEHPEVAEAVLQHQERLDGSGYPFRLQGEAIGLLARIVAVADASASIVSRYPGSERLSAWMRLNRRKYDPALVSLLQRGLSGKRSGATNSGRLDATEIEAAAQLLRHWNDFSAAAHDHPPPELSFLFERMADLRTILLQFGLDPDRPESLRALAREDDLAAELVAAFDEVRRQITDLQRETLRRREAVARTLPGKDRLRLDNWLDEIRAYLRAATPPPLTPAAERRHGEAGNGASP